MGEHSNNHTIWRHLMQQKLVIKIFVLAFLVCLFWATSGFSEISVYDANDQYIGVYLASFNSNGTFTKNVIEVFNPSLGNSLFIQKENIVEEEIFFDSNGCTGKAYVIGSGFGSGATYCDAMFAVIIKDKCQDKYYVTINNDITSIIPNSRADWECQCQQYTGTSELSLSEVSEISKASFPFTLPFALPLKLQYSAGGDINGDGNIGLEEAVNALQVTSGIKN